MAEDKINHNKEFDPGTGHGSRRKQWSDLNMFWDKYDSPEESKKRGVSEEHRLSHKTMNWVGPERKRHAGAAQKARRKTDKIRKDKERSDFVAKRQAIHDKDQSKIEKRHDKEHAGGGATTTAFAAAPKKTTTVKTTTAKPTKAQAVYTASQKKHLASRRTTKPTTVSAPKTSTFASKFTTQQVKDSGDRRSRRRAGLMKQSTPGIVT